MQEIITGKKRKKKKMVKKTSIKIDTELNRQLAIFSLLEKIKKEEFTDIVIKEGLKIYQDKYNRYKFR